MPNLEVRDHPLGGYMITDRGATLGTEHTNRYNDLFETIIVADTLAGDGDVTINVKRPATREQEDN